MMRGNNDEGMVDYFPFVIACHRDFVGRPQRRRPLGKPRCIEEEDLKMDHKDVGWEEELH